VGWKYPSSSCGLEVSLPLPWLTLLSQVEADDAEVAKLEAQRLEYLTDAARYYVHTLIASDKYWHAVFPLCHLWFNDTGATVSHCLARDGAGAASRAGENMLRRIPTAR
jgi:hypothetical protein